MYVCPALTDHKITFYISEMKTDIKFYPENSQFTTGISFRFPFPFNGIVASVDKAKGKVVPVFF
jgi:hypothetical protein